jgi:serine phosphatase RsbU (regulator of sigma subunit)
MTASRNNKLVVCVGDAMGHGDEASGMAAEMRRILEIVLKNTGSESPGFMLRYCSFLFNLNNSSNRNYYSQTSDLAICEFDMETLMMRYCSAKINIILVRRGFATKLKNNRTAIGCITEGRYNPKSHSLQLERGDRVYVYTDGIIDQFGGASDKKLGTKNLSAFLEKIAAGSIENEKDQLDKLLRSWQSGYEQTDDMTIFGLQV